MESALNQFKQRAARVLSEAFPPPKKYASEANWHTLALRFPLEGFLPSDIMFKNEAQLLIASGAIVPTAAWQDAFREFFNTSVGRSFSLDCNRPIFEKYIGLADPSVSLLTQIASEHVNELVLTNEAAAQAAEDTRRAQLWEEFAPKLLTPYEMPNQYARAIENKRIEARRNEMWEWPLSRFEELKTKKDMHNMSKEELRAIVNKAEPARIQKMVAGERHENAEPSQLELLRTRGEAEVKAGMFQPIPQQWQIPGKEISVDFSFALLAQLPKEIVQRMMQRWGNNQVTWRCQETRQRLSARK
jgi:hypothetical protein